MVTTVTGNSHYGDDRHKDDLPRLYAGHTGSMRKWKLLVLMYRVEKVQEVGRAAINSGSLAILAAIRRASSDVVAIDDGFTEWPSAGPARLPGWRDPSRCNAPVHAGDRRRDYAPGHCSE